MLGSWLVLFANHQVQGKKDVRVYITRASITFTAERSTSGRNTLVHHINRSSETSSSNVIYNC